MNGLEFNTHFSPSALEVLRAVLDAGGTAANNQSASLDKIYNSLIPKPPGG
jgi:hypothetical protein